MPFIGYHAMDRYRLHQPDAEYEDVELALHWGTDIDPEFVQILTQRLKLDRSSRYVVSPDKRGIFVINKESDFVVTYLRLHESQRQWLMPTTSLQDPGPTPKPAQVVPELTPEMRERRAQRVQKPVAAYNASYMAELEKRYQAALPEIPPEDEETEEISSDDMATRRRKAFESKILEQYGFKGESM